MITITKTFPILICLFLAGALFSCQSDVLKDAADTYGPQAAISVDDPDCVEGTEHDFELDDQYLPQTGLNISPDEVVSHHIIMVADASYNPNDACMCLVSDIHLDFLNIPDGKDFDLTQIRILDQDGADIPRDITHGDVGEPSRITVDGANSVEDMYLVVPNSLDPLPHLTLAGGLCMIDNLSNPSPGEYIYHPYIEEERDRDGNLIERRVFMPIEGAWGELLKTLK